MPASGNFLEPAWSYEEIAAETLNLSTKWKKWSEDFIDLAHLSSFVKSNSIEEVWNIAVRPNLIMSRRNEGLDAQSAAEKAVSVIGAGYDLCKDIRLSACKFGPDGCRLMELDPNHTREVVFPDGVVVPNVPAAVKCHKGERSRIASEVLSFNQVISPFRLAK